MDEINGRIQLPYGFLEEETREKFHLDLPNNFKKELLFENLPFVAQLNNPAIENVVKGKTSDDLSIQKYLLATGLLEDTIQNNLDMIVTDNEFNNAGVRRVLDQKYPTIMGKPTATSFMFKEKAKFDIQNPIIGSLYNEVLTDKQKEKKQLEEIGKAPSITDLNIQKRLDALKKFEEGIDDDDDDDDDDNNDNKGNRGNNNLNDPFARIDLPNLPQTPPPSAGLPTPPATPGPSSATPGPSSATPGQSSIQNFLLDNSTPISSSVLELEKPKTVNLSNTLQKVFPKLGSKLSLPTKSEDEVKDFDITESTAVANREEVVSLEFFEPGGSWQKLVEAALKNVGELNKSNDEFLKYLSSNFGKFILAKNKMKIHLETGNIYIEGKSTGESLYNFLRNQEDITKKELIIDIPIQNNFNKYVQEILTNIVDDDYDLQTNSTSKFLFYNFNNIRQHVERKTPFPVIHSEIIGNEAGLETVQNYNWQYFIEKIIGISNNEKLLERDDFKDDEAFEDYLIIEKTQKNLNYCKEFYNGVYDDIAFFFQRKIHEIPDEHVQDMIEDLSNYRVYFKDIKKVESSQELLTIFSNFYFKTGRFPGVHNLLNVPPGVNPPFIQKHDRLSPFEIHEKFNGSEAYGLISVQFLSALNIYFGGDKYTSQNVMSEYLHNLSLQALTIDDDRWEIQFYEIEKLADDLKNHMRNSTRYDIEVDEDEIFEKKFAIEKDRMQKIFDEIKNKELSTLEYPNQDFRVLPDTQEKINQQSKERDAFEKKTEESLSEQDREISEAVLLESKKKLIESVTDNATTLSENEINTISSISIPVINQTPTVEERLRENVKKDNAKFLKKSSINIKLSPPKKTKKKPYDRE